MNPAVFAAACALCHGVRRRGLSRWATPCVMRCEGCGLVSTRGIVRIATRLLQVRPEEHRHYVTAATLGAPLLKTGFRVEALEAFDRHRSLTAMGASTTPHGPLAALRPLISGGHRLLGDLIVRPRLRENLLAVAVKA